MAKICPKCGREFENSRIMCSICKCNLVSDGIDNSEEARRERLKVLQQRQTQGVQTRNTVNTQKVSEKTIQSKAPSQNAVRKPHFVTWKLASGILSIVLFVFVAFQSCAAGLGNAITNNGEVSGSGGIIVAILMLSGGIVSVATRKNEGNGGNIALIVLFSLASLVGFVSAGSFADLNIWAAWCLVNAVIAIIALIK